MSFRSRLFHWPDPYDTAATDALFTDAARECAAYHAAHCPPYRAILDAAGFSPDDLHTVDDLARIPPIPTAFLKTHRLRSMPPARTPIRATSSGTGGRASEIGLDWGACFAGLSMVLKVAAPRALVSPKPCHYIVFSYMPRRENAMAAAKTAYGYTFLAPALSRTFALRWENGQYVPDLDRVIRAIVKHAASPFPTRFIGFPAYTYFTLRRMDERGIRLTLPAGSAAAGSSSGARRWTRRPCTPSPPASSASRRRRSRRATARRSIRSSTATAGTTASTSPSIPAS